MKYARPIVILFFLFALAQPVLAITVEVTAIVPGCGDGIVSNGEQCDGGNLNGASCADVGYSSGTLSCTASCLFDATSCSTAPAGGGGGGGGGGSGASKSSTTVVVTGRAYPGSTVTLLKDAQVAASTIASSNANFQINLSGLSSGNYFFSLYSEDAQGNRSSLLTFPVGITKNAITKISDVFIAPTIATDKREVSRGDTIRIFGQSAPSSEVTINVNSSQEHFIKRMTDQSGAYLVNFDSSLLEFGTHTTKSKAAVDGEISTFSKAISFTVGTRNIPVEQVGAFATVSRLGDFNHDGRVNLIDLSMVAHWYKKSAPPDFFDLSNDGVVDLVDLSILASHWSG